jgi:hypothetical protein
MGFKIEELPTIGYPVGASGDQCSEGASGGIPVRFRHVNGKQLGLQALVAVQLEDDHGVQLVPGQNATLASEILSDVLHERASFASFNFCLHLANGRDNPLFNRQGLAA